MPTAEAFAKEHDQKIQDDVVQQIDWQPEIESKDICVKVSDANVALTGYVHNYLEKAAAEKAAKAVVGVISVANDIEVRPNPERSDPEIARDVIDALRLHSKVPEDQLKITVRDGFVTLEGAVTWHFQRTNAEQVATGVKGVRGIVNAMTIAPTVSTEQVKEKIEEAWRRSIDLDARLMTVVASDGHVALYGTVHSWKQRDQAEAAAWQAPGVRTRSGVARPVSLPPGAL